jgi:predicted Zn-ribbon and HTH transcriptional regulator
MTIKKVNVNVLKSRKMKVVKVKCICDLCKYSWFPKIKKRSKQCPNCKRQDWNKNE